MPDFTTYLPPGVYVEEVPGPAVSVVGVSPTVVAIVGPSVGYRSHTQTVQLNGTNPVRLDKLGIDTANGFVVRDSSGVDISPAGWDLIVGAGQDASLTNDIDNTTDIVRVEPAVGTAPIIPDGAVVFISYNYTDADYYAPRRVFDYDDVRRIFGEAVDLANGEVISPLSLAAKLAFENGARELVLVSTTGFAYQTTRGELSAAYTKLDAEYEVNIIVPLPVGVSGTTVAPGEVTSIGSDLKNYLDASFRENLLRIGIVGYGGGVTIPPDEIVSSYRSERLMLAWPNRMQYYVGLSNQVVDVDGYYLAAAYAGRIASLPVQMPLTKKDISGFSGIPSGVLGALTTSYKNKLSAAGVAVTELSRDRRLLVRHGTTTNRATVATRELSVVRARDALMRLIQDTIERSDLVGVPIDLNTPNRVKSVVAGTLEAALNTQVVIEYRNLKARQTSLDPTVIEIKFEYIPAYPLNYIVVAFSIATATGDVNLAGNEAAA